ncbi:serine aminopeptidase domain-containing protein, partial [Clostridioides difficile]|uniref:serine aminopeptidase domain-containing protein n=6 Tax=Clostridioides difficile TaxID=1496 RepID=UPI0025511001
NNICKNRRNYGDGLWRISKTYVSMQNSMKQEPCDFSQGRFRFGGEIIRRNEKTKFDWLSRDKEQVEKYINDPFCGVVCSCGFFYDLVQGLKEIEDKENLKKVPLDIPIYIISGDKDPIGKNGKGVLRLRDRYIKLGVKDVTCKLYKDGRHELLNEINREEVFEDIICWLNNKIEIL